VLQCEPPKAVASGKPIACYRKLMRNPAHPEIFTSAPQDAMYRFRRCVMDNVVEIERPRNAPSELQTFANDSDRRRLTGAAAKAVVRLAAAWGVGNAESAALLGVSESTWDRIKAGRWDGVLSQDQLTRASALIGIFKGLHLLFADGMADRWPSLPNRGPIFARQSPIAAMIDGGIPRMLETRQYIDALRGGL
jgi:hypothetical protein